MSGVVARVGGQVWPVLQTPDGPKVHIDGRLRSLESLGEDCIVECAPVIIPAHDGTFARFETGSGLPFGEMDLRVVAWEIVPGGAYARPWLAGQDSMGVTVEPLSSFDNQEGQWFAEEYIWPNGDA